MFLELGNACEAEVKNIIRQGQGGLTYPACAKKTIKIPEKEKKKLQGFFCFFEITGSILSFYGWPVFGHIKKIIVSRMADWDRKKNGSERSSDALYKRRKV